MIFPLMKELLEQFTDLDDTDPYNDDQMQDLGRIEDLIDLVIARTRKIQRMIDRKLHVNNEANDQLAFAEVDGRTKMARYQNVRREIFGGTPASHSSPIWMVHMKNKRSGAVGPALVAIWYGVVPLPSQPDPQDDAYNKRCYAEYCKQLDQASLTTHKLAVLYKSLKAQSDKIYKRTDQK